MYGKRAILIWFRALKKAIPHHSTLAVSYLACHIARQAILPTDICKWAVEAKLPYLTVFSDIDVLLGRSPDACFLRSRTLFRPFFVVGAWDLEAMAGNIAKSIGLSLPPVNFYSLASCFLKELCLPLEKILPHACRLYEWSMPVELCLSTNSLRLPTRVHVMAILVVTIRILYRIHGQGVWELSLLDSNFSEFEEVHDSSSDEEDAHKSCDSPGTDGDAEMTTKSMLTEPSQGQRSEYNTIELLRAVDAAYNNIGQRKYSYSRDFSSYLKYCKEVVAKGVSTSYEENALIKILADICEKQEKDRPIGKTDVNNKRTREDVVGNDLDDGDKVQPWIKELSEKEKLSCLHDEAIKRLKLDMEENWFQYLPPRKHKIPDERYLYYRRIRTLGSLCYVAHADYYILLRAFARLAQVDCRIMHIGVLQLERRLAWIERHISKSLLSIVDGSLGYMLNNYTSIVEDLIDEDLE